MADFVSPLSINNPTTGQLAPVAWGDGLNTAIDHLATNKPVCQVYRSTTLSIPAAGAATVIPMDSERSDPQAMHSTSSNTSRIVIPYTGLYLVGACVPFPADADALGYREIYVTQNGDSGNAIVTSQATAGVNAMVLNVDGIRRITAGVYLEVFVRISTVGDVSLTMPVHASGPSFWVCWLGT